MVDPKVVCEWLGWVSGCFDLVLDSVAAALDHEALEAVPTGQLPNSTLSATQRRRGLTAFPAIEVVVSAETILVGAVVRPSVWRAAGPAADARNGGGVGRSRVLAVGAHKACCLARFSGRLKPLEDQ